MRKADNQTEADSISQSPVIAFRASTTSGFARLRRSAHWQLIVDELQKLNGRRAAERRAGYA
ncbi:MAG: hypothetical protein KDI75_09410 [Xanthomonadales bacterium]|nr:hypothetical protein [Xanthomonadales bacterium]